MKSQGSKLRDELRACAMFNTMPVARIPVERWRRDYNRSSPHGALGYRMCPGLPGPSALLLLPTVRNFGIFNQIDLLAIRSNDLAAQQNRFDIISNFMKVEECTGN